MGYTHYWKADRPFTIGEWVQLTEFAQKVVTHSSIVVQREYDLTDPAEINAARICFNGRGDAGHETFALTPAPTSFDFCKTARKPYDAAVVAILIAAREIAPSAFNWSSDGDRDDHKVGAALYNAITGADVQPNAGGYVD